MKGLTQHQKLDLIIAKLDKLLIPKVNPKSPFDPGPVVPLPPEPEPKEVVWPVVDFSNYSIGTCKTCVSYYADLERLGFAGLVAEIRTFWDKRDTFYPAIKEFMAKYPEFFPCKDCV